MTGSTSRRTPRRDARTRSATAIHAPGVAFALSAVLLAAAPADGGAPAATTSGSGDASFRRPTRVTAPPPPRSRPAPIESPTTIEPVAPDRTGPASAEGAERDEPTDESPESRAAAPPAWREPRSAFHVARNKNRNQVHYAVDLDDECRPDGKRPVDNYWLRLEDDPPTKRDLTLFQQQGYGFDSQAVDEGRIRVVLKAIESRPIEIRSRLGTTGCIVAAFIRIGDAPALFDHAYVHADPGWLIPKVRYIDLFGARADGQRVEERIIPD